MLKFQHLSYKTVSSVKIQKGTVVKFCRTFESWSWSTKPNTVVCFLSPEKIVSKNSVSSPVDHLKAYCPWQDYFSDFEIRIKAAMSKV